MNTQLLVQVLGGIGLAWYVLCVLSVGAKPIPAGQPPDTLRVFMSLSITTISVSLATFVGLLLGIQSAERSAAKSALPTENFEKLANDVATTLPQGLAASVYVISLLLALGFWVKHRDNTDSAITKLAQSLLGLVGGALTAALNMPS